MSEQHPPCYLVTGGSKGIGKAICLQLAQQGARVVILARPSSALDETTRMVQQSSPNSFSLACDLANTVSINAAAASARTQLARLDGVVHNAGDIGPIKSIFGTDQDAWQRNIVVNLLGVQALTQALSPLFEGGHRVRVTTISSGAAVRPIPSWSAYCTAKAGLEMWTKCLALEGAEVNLSAVSVAPGIVNTDMQAYIRGSAVQDFPLHAQFVGYYGNGQLTNAEDVATKLVPLITQHTMEQSGQRFDVRDL